jgi:hypothetical protein
MKWEIGRLKGLPRWVVIALLILLGVPVLLAVFLWFNPIVF